MKIKTGKGTVTLAVLLAIWSVSAIASLPGLAISPILGDLNKIFPKATDLEIQMLTSLPSLLIIPFVLLAGKLSVGRDKLKILAVGLSIFFLSGVACLFARSMMWLIVISCILGIGAGMVIPFSTGLVVDYFTGDYRVRQLGYSSSINNLTLVLATVVTGYLANVDWHLPFLVYTLPGISLALSFLLKRQRSVPEPEQSIQLRHKMIDRRKLAGLMAFYFFVTYAVLVVTFYASFLIDDYKIVFRGADLAVFPCDHAAGAVHRQHHPLFEAERQPRGARAGLCGAAVCRGFPRQGDAGLRGALHRAGIRDHAACHLRQGGDHRPAAFRYAGPFVRHVGELPGRDGLPFYRRPLPSRFRDAQRPLPLLFQCRAGAGRGCRHTPAPG